MEKTSELQFRFEVQNLQNLTRYYLEKFFSQLVLLMFTFTVKLPFISTF